MLGRQRLLRCHFPFERVDQLDVELELPAEEPGRERQVLLAVRKLVRGLLGPVQSRLKVSDVVGHSALIDPSRAECRAG